MTRTIRIRVLGPLMVDGAPVSAARQQRVVLAALAMAAGRSLSADTLVEGLWGATAPTDARKAIQVLITRLRRGLASADLAIDHAGGGYGLAVDPSAIDAFRFRELCDAELRMAEGDMSGRRRVLDEALDLWRGDAFGDLGDEPLLAGDAAELALRRERAVERLHELRLAAGEGTDAIADLTMWAQRRPLDEAAWCRLAIALWESGRATEALRALQFHRRAIRETAGLQPTAALVALEAAIAGSGDAAAREGRRLPPRYLLMRTTSFVGRRSELDVLAGAVATDRLVTVVGPGGVGKTRLVVELIDTMTSSFPGEVLMCELASIDRAGSVPHAVLAACGGAAAPGRSVTESVVAALQARRAILVLDNCEHVAEPIATVIESVIAGCPDVHIVATSRQALLVRGEVRFDLGPLPTSPSEVNGDSAASDAVQLFTDRLSLHSRRLVDATAARQIGEICRRLDGIPLAIELAAARARTIPLGELATVLGAEGVLVDERRGIEERQRTLHRTIEWSYRLLDRSEQDMFDRLAVCQGGFDAATAASIGGVDLTRARGILEGLLDKSMVRVDADHAGRFSMLELFRQFGVERLVERGILGETRSRHLEHFVARAEQLGGLVRGSDEEVAVPMLAREVDNLRVAHVTSLEIADCDLAARLIAALHEDFFWRQRVELGDWAKALLGLPGIDSHRLVSWVLATAGRGSLLAGDLDEGEALARRGVTLVESASGAPCGWLWDVIGHCGYFRGDNDLLLEAGEREITDARGSDDQYRLAYVLADNAAHRGIIGDRELSHDRASEALAIAKRLRNPTVMAMAYLALGYTDRDHQPEVALERFGAAARWARRVGAGFILGLAESEMAFLRLAAGLDATAIDAVRDQIRHFRDAGDLARVRMLIHKVLPTVLKLESAVDDGVALAGYLAEHPRSTDDEADRVAEASLDETRSRLGEMAFRARLERGRTLTDQEAIALAFDLLDRVALEEVPGADQPSSAASHSSTAAENSAGSS